jgi:hypothetical protein
MKLSVIPLITIVVLSGCESEAERFANGSWSQRMTKCAAGYVLYKPSNTPTIYECRGPKIVTEAFAATDEEWPAGVEWMGRSTLQCSSAHTKSVGSNFSDWPEDSIATAQMTKTAGNWEFKLNNYDFAVNPDCVLLGK